MKPEEFTSRLLSLCGSRLKSIILFGSAAAGDYIEKKSDYNILVVLNQLGLEELKLVSKPTRSWVKNGNPAPLIFTKERLQKSADVFPIEIADMKESNRVLFGEDVVAGLQVNNENLRLELEHELKGKLIQLRERYLLTSGKGSDVKELMVRSLSTFLVLFRAALRLYQQKIPVKKIDATRDLAKHISFNISPFESVEALKEGRPVQSFDSDTLFSEYLKSIEDVVDAVDDFLHKA